MTSGPLPEHLRRLFWDYDFERLAWPDSRDLVIARILQKRGRRRHPLAPPEPRRQGAGRLDTSVARSGPRSTAIAILAARTRSSLRRSRPLDRRLPQAPPGREVLVSIAHAEIMPPAQEELLRVLGPLACRLGYYLAGGTAVGLRLGHRQSIDFDWFAERPVTRPPAVPEAVQTAGMANGPVLSLPWTPWPFGRRDRRDRNVGAI